MNCLSNTMMCLSNTIMFFKYHDVFVKYHDVFVKYHDVFFIVEVHIFDDGEVLECFDASFTGALEYRALHVVADAAILAFERTRQFFR